LTTTKTTINTKKKSTKSKPDLLNSNQNKVINNLNSSKSTVKIR